MNAHTDGTLLGWETRRSGRPPAKEVHVTLNLNRHLRDAVKAEAEVRGMSMNGFMRAMIRGYFAAALHGR